MSNNSKKFTLITRKVLIVFLILSLACCNFIIVGQHIFKSLISYALDDTELPQQDVIKEELVSNALVHVNDEIKKVIQYKITTGIEAKESPIKSTRIRLRTNIVEGYNLEDVKISKINKNSYTVGEWTLENEKVNITLTNEAESLTEKEQGLDELLVTYIYAINEEQKQQIEETEEPLEEDILNAVEEIAITTYSNDIIIKTQLTHTNKLACTEEPFAILNIKNNDIHKTTITEDKVDFVELLDVNLKYKLDNLGEIIIEDEATIFADNDNIEIEDGTAVMYKKTMFNKQDLIELLGLDGVLEIINNERVLATITKEKMEVQELNAKAEQEFIVDSQEDSQEELKEIRSYITVTQDNVEVEYKDEISNLKIRLSNLNSEEEGNIDVSNLNIENTKTIVNIQNIDSLNYLKEIKKCIFNEKEEILESTIKFKDTVTRAYFGVDNSEWELGKTNNVNFTIVLDTTKDKSELFVNPMLILELPAGVESVDNDKSQFIIENDNGAFKVANVNVVSLLGTKYVLVNLEGEQTEETIANGNTTVDISLSLNIKEDTEQNETAKLYYKNNTVTVYENSKTFGMAELTVSYSKQEISENNLEGNVPLETTEEIEEQAEENVQNINENEAEETNETLLNNEEIFLSVDTSSELVRVGDDFYFNLFIDNNSLANQDNVWVEYVVPDGLRFMDAEIFNYNSETFGYTDELDAKMLTHYNKETKTLNANLSFFKPASEIEVDNGTMIVGSSKLLKIKVRALNLPQDVYSSIKDNKFSVINNGIKCLEQNKQITVSDSFIRIEANKIKEDLDANVVVFEIDANNLGLFANGNAEVNYVLPNEYIPNYIETDEFSSPAKDNNITTMVSIPAQSTYKIFVYASYKEDALISAKENNINANQNENTAINVGNNNLQANEISNIVNTSLRSVINNINKLINSDNFITRFFSNLYKGGM